MTQTIAPADHAPAGGIATTELCSRPAHAAATRSRALGALAVGAIAFGALAVGAIAIGRLVIGRARITRLEIDELVVRNLHITQVLHMPSKPDPESSI